MAYDQEVCGLGQSRPRLRGRREYSPDVREPYVGVMTLHSPWEEYLPSFGGMVELL